MTQTTQVTLDQALEMVALLPVDDQTTLLKILQKKQKAKLHEEFWTEVAQSRKEISEGRFVRGDVDTIMEALNK